MNKVKGVFFCTIIAVIATFFARFLPIIGAPVIGIILGMLINIFYKNRNTLEDGIKFSAKKILQYAVVLLGFGLNLSVVIKTGKESLPIIISTISISLIVAYIVHKTLHISSNISTLIGVGSSICGGSAIAVTAPIINADEEEIAKSISVIFFFNVCAAILFPILGKVLGFDTLSGDAFGMFAGTAINDTSSVTAAASTWDSIYNLGTQTLDRAVTVKLTRMLAIIPISLILSYIVSKKNKNNSDNVDIRKTFPIFIFYFIIASIITTLAINRGVDISVFHFAKLFAKFLIVVSMVGIGLNTDIIKLVKTSGKPILMGGICSIFIVCTSLIMQYILGIW